MPDRLLVLKWSRPKAIQLRGILKRLNLCSCGTTAHWKCLLELLSEAESHTEHGFYRDAWTEFGAKVLDSRGLIDHGTGIGFAWLTDDGKLLLNFLRDFGIADDIPLPEWAEESSWTVEAEKNDLYSQWEAGEGGTSSWAG